MVPSSRGPIPGRHNSGRRRPARTEGAAVTLARSLTPLSDPPHSIPGKAWGDVRPTQEEVVGAQGGVLHGACQGPCGSSPELGEDEAEDALNQLADHRGDNNQAMKMLIQNQQAVFF